MDSYKTIKKAAAVELIEKRSRFIARIRPVQTREQAEAFLCEVRSKHWDASHNVPAYVLREGQAQRYSDDGEPGGTAGLPVLDVLRKEGLTDCAVVVTRYFGGVLLGTGGLVRAYSHSAKLAVEAGGVILMCQCAVLRLGCDYSFYGKLESFLAAAQAEDVTADFGAGVTVTFRIPLEELEQFQKKLTELSFGRVTATELSRSFAPVKRT